jgi:hypothetical protein
MLVDATPDAEAAATAVLAGRADLCLGRPLAASLSSRL